MFRKMHILRRTFVGGFLGGIGGGFNVLSRFMQA